MSEMPESELDALLTDARKHEKNQQLGRAADSYAQLLLTRGDLQYRIEAARALGRLRASSDSLLQCLQNDPVPAVRKTVVQALASFQGARIGQALQIAAVVDPDLGVRFYATLIELHLRQPNMVLSWLGMFANTPIDPLGFFVTDAQLFLNELSQAGGHVFISYSHRDAREFTLQLVDILRSEHQFRVWVDTELKPGTESWRRSVARAIEQASLVLLILSPEAHDSFEIGEELEYAKQLGKDRLFVRYKQTHMLFGMSQMQGLPENLTYEDYPEETLKALVEELIRRDIPRDK